MMKIGYFGDGPWAHETFKKLILDDTIKIYFATVRFDNRDSILVSMAEEREIPVILSSNINSD